MSTFEPAATIVSKLGGPTAVASIVGVHRTRVSNWMRDRSSGGTGGVIPMKHVAKLLEYAKSNGVDIKAEDFIPVMEETTRPFRSPLSPDTSPQTAPIPLATEEVTGGAA